MKTWRNVNDISVKVHKILKQLHRKADKPELKKCDHSVSISNQYDIHR